MAKRKQRRPPPRTDGRMVAGTWQPDYGQGCHDGQEGTVPLAAMTLPASTIRVRATDPAWQEGMKSAASRQGSINYAAWCQTLHRTPKQFIGASKQYLDGARKAESKKGIDDAAMRLIRNQCVQSLGNDAVRAFERAGGRLVDLVAAIEQAGA